MWCRGLKRRYDALQRKGLRAAFGVVLRDFASACVDDGDGRTGKGP